ncbi:maleylpyruvate isomerase family mycothiol-dependent enzyme [Arthrobacter cryoconiti]|uniref:Maleylpyruvate isomerase family mycothiol-dependent enzyme n=1 Tax=Arthrobacter cryoconiti TaxID=748907 RepID=A0ABV8R001_9MICC|nr:maleylpyruvate isomerase family mycothiol-dependent enzyme [Arthrobacter cryoconiti]MCC9068489.1 maleylpyruvate isomerase family mycothiol-dependent enzyme [Arthrobacter cryoconiti]
MVKSSDGYLWQLVHTERAALARELAALTPEQWHHQSLCGRWDVEDVVAHLTAAASLTQWPWLRSMVMARFQPDVHNQRRLQEHRGNTSAATLERFRAVINSNIAPSSHTSAYLGEVLVHAQDIRRVLGLPHTPSIEASTAVAEFYANRNFAVASRTRVKGLHLSADDGPFSAGTGPRVTGPTIALVMVMAGRWQYLEDLQGHGVEALRSRLESSPA